MIALEPKIRAEEFKGDLFGALHASRSPSRRLDADNERDGIVGARLSVTAEERRENYVFLIINTPLFIVQKTRIKRFSCRSRRGGLKGDVKWWSVALSRSGVPSAPPAVGSCMDNKPGRTNLIMAFRTLESDTLHFGSLDIRHVHDVPSSSDKCNIQELVRSLHDNECSVSILNAQKGIRTTSHRRVGERRNLGGVVDVDADSRAHSGGGRARARRPPAAPALERAARPWRPPSRSALILSSK
ncbi:hypothetical protein EVAR_77227_1 [Eumeta japonica]|uniref:Uncharacterized protein n=1 Tax=Eumeta variegata TaxID=151549 RepID=A0A4C1T263_EUMVA|nr:hypothetical protein EVAR_77227_1 [Eumeta japonica]